MNLNIKNIYKAEMYVVLWLKKYCGVIRVKMH